MSSNANSFSSTSSSPPKLLGVLCFSRIPWVRHGSDPLLVLRCSSPLMLPSHMHEREFVLIGKILDFIFKAKKQQGRDQRSDLKFTRVNDAPSMVLWIKPFALISVSHQRIERQKQHCGNGLLAKRAAKPPSFPRNRSLLIQTSAACFERLRSHSPRYCCDLCPQR